VCYITDIIKIIHLSKLLLGKSPVMLSAIIVVEHFCNQLRKTWRKYSTFI